MNPIDGDRFYAFLKEQKVKETGAFSKGLNKGLNIALSALKNKEITLPWEVDRVVHGRWVGHIEDDSIAPPGTVACSNCHHFTRSQFVCIWNYCPHCGADMRGSNDE